MDGSPPAPRGSTSLNDTSADDLIRTIISTRRRPTDDEIAQIAERIASAPFQTTIVRVPHYLRVPFQGRTLGSREPSLLAHLIKRTHGEGQWHETATLDEYLADLRRAARSPAARLVLYTRWGEQNAATISPTASAVPRSRRGPDWLPNILVVYSADRSVIRTGYMFSDLATIDLPKDALWLK